MSNMLVRDLSGQRFSRLTVLKRVENDNGGAVKWLCQCDCGNLTKVQRSNLVSGGTKSCGCWRREKPPYRNIKHGQFGTRLYGIWQNMKQRCYNPKSVNYMYYGGRGIGICEEWRTTPNSFFKWAKENGYSDELTIDRINNDADYSPDNCRWVTMLEQSKNKSNHDQYTKATESKRFTIA